jgi:hypothetical protein
MSSPTQSDVEMRGSRKRRIKAGDRTTRTTM